MIKTNDWGQVVKEAKSRGYTAKADGSGMINGSGKELTSSTSGGSATAGGNTYTSLSQLKKSKRW